MHRTRPKVMALGLGFGFLVVITLAGTLWSGLVVRDIDLNSGRVRERRYVLGLRLEERLIDTPFAQLAAGYRPVEGPPSWREATRTALGFYKFFFPQYSSTRYGGLISACNDFVKVMAVIKPDHVESEELVSNVLQFLRRGDEEAIRRYNQKLLIGDGTTR